MKRFILFILTIFLASCAEKSLLQLSQREMILKSQGDYNSYLALEYLQFSKNFANIKDEKNSEYFANKGLDAANGEDIIPENPLSWHADPNQLEEMILMQKKLEMVLDEPQMKFYLPIQLSHLTYLYDCWISRESTEIFRADELAPCRVKFYKLLDELENYIAEQKKDRQPKVEIKEPEFKRFEIIFDLDSSKFNDKANKDLLDALQYLTSLKGDYRLLLLGNADRTASNLYNDALAMRRSETVKDYLIKNGIPERLIEIRSAGEDFPDILTKDNVQQQANRRVGIYVIEGLESPDLPPLPLIRNKIYRQDIDKAREKRGVIDENE